MDLHSVLEQRSKVEEFQRKHRVGLLTLLFTDLVGSTKLKQELGDHVAVSLIQRHHSMVREILGQFAEGEEIDTAGDSFFIVFAKPSDAVRFALMLQSRLRQWAKETRRALSSAHGPRAWVHVAEGEVSLNGTIFEWSRCRGGQRRKHAGNQPGRVPLFELNQLRSELAPT